MNKNMIMFSILMLGLMIFSACSLAPPSDECVDSDSDGYGVNCDLGSDCNDNNKFVYNTISCQFDGSTCGQVDLCALNCPRPPFESCADGEDNDCNGLIDCDDSYCDIDSACQTNDDDLFAINSRSEETQEDSSVN